MLHLPGLLLAAAAVGQAVLIRCQLDVQLQGDSRFKGQAIEQHILMNGSRGAIETRSTGKV